MGRGSRGGRRRAASSDGSDDEDADGISGARIDPKIALQLADLSNSARDRQTAHDLEVDRRVDLKQIEWVRKCNHKGSQEAKIAEANKDRLKGWNSLGGTDSTTNLEDIAAGQYHRLATSQRVQAETRQLRMEANERNAEPRDSKHNNAPRPLDPAVDPSRVYVYKNKTRQASNQTAARGHASPRGGRARGRGGFVAQPGRGALINVNTSHVGSLSELRSASTASPGGMSARAARQRQQGYGPALRLMENPMPPSKLPSDVTTPDSSSARTIVEAVDPEVKDATSTAPTTTLNIANASAASMQLTVSTPQVSSSDSNNTKPRPSNKVKGELAEDFSNWFKAATFTQPPVQAVAREAHSDQQVSSSSNSKKFSTALHNDFEQAADIASRIAQDHYTDGRLTPVDFSDIDNSSDSVEIISMSKSNCVSTSAEIDLMSQPIPTGLGIVTQEPISPIVREERQESLESINIDRTKEMLSTPLATKPPRQNPFADPESQEMADKSQGTADFKLEKQDEQVREALAPRGSPLHPKSSNVSLGISASKSKQAIPDPKTQMSDVHVGRVQSPSDQTISSAVGLMRGGSSNVYRQGLTRVTILGDDSNVRRQEPRESDSSSSLHQSRYANEKPTTHKPTHIKRQEAGAGYQMLLKELASKKLSVNNNRRPDEPAFRKVTDDGAFTKYRESQVVGSGSEDDEL